MLEWFGVAAGVVALGAGYPYASDLELGTGLIGYAAGMAPTVRLVVRYSRLYDGDAHLVPPGALAVYAFLWPLFALGLAGAAVRGED